MVIADAYEFRLRRIVVARVDTPLLHVGEEGLQGVEVSGLDRVELMVMALGAAEGAAQPSIGDRAHAFGAVFRKVFLRLGAAFAGHHVQAVIAARDELFFGRIGQQVAGELLTREDVERLVGVERVDDVVAVGEDALILVAVVADRVGEAGDIQPPDRHAFTEVGRGQQAIDLLLIGIGRFVGQEDGGLGGRRRQAGQVKRDATQQAFLGGFRGRDDFLLGEFSSNESVDRVLACRRHRRHDRCFEWFVCPVRFVHGALGDPSAEEFFLGGREGLVRLLFGHDVFSVGREDTFDDLALFWLAGYDGDLAALAGLQRILANV